MSVSIQSFVGDPKVGRGRVQSGRLTFNHENVPVWRVRTHCMVWVHSHHTGIDNCQNASNSRHKCFYLV